MRLLLVFALALAGCESTLVTTAPDACVPVIDALEPAVGPESGGTSVRISGLHVGSEFGERDVVVHLGGAQAEVTAVFRGDGCDPCDVCVAELFSCAQCERVCRGIATHTDAEETVWGPATCEEWVDFITPAGAGTAELVLQNSRGAVGGSEFEYTAGADDDDSAGDDDDSAR